MSGFILIDVFTSIKDIDPIKLFSVATTKTNQTFKPFKKNPWFDEKVSNLKDIH
jgi:hypothetical protein